MRVCVCVHACMYPCVCGPVTPKREIAVVGLLEKYGGMGVPGNLGIQAISGCSDCLGNLKIV